MSKRKLTGFGYDPDDTTQHFIVNHPKERAICLEHCINDQRRLVARLSWNQWIEIAQPVAAEIVGLHEARRLLDEYSRVKAALATLKGVLDA